MVEREKGETTTETIYIISGDDPITCSLYDDKNNLLLKLPSNLMLIYISATLNYILIKVIFFIYYNVLPIMTGASATVTDPPNEYIIAYMNKNSIIKK